MHICVHYPIAEKMKLAKLLGLEEVVILAYSVFVGYVYLHHEGYGLWGSHSLHYDAYLVRSIYGLKGVLAFASGASLIVDKMPATAS